MSVTNDVIRSMWLEGINDAQPSENGLSAWLPNAPNSIAQGVAASHALIGSVDRDGLIEAFAFDANRFLSASIETSLDLSKVERRTHELAWLFVKAYYSAFYSAHGIMRACGRAAFLLEGRALRSLQAFALGYGTPPPPISPGMTLAIANSKSVTLTIQPLGGSQSHQLMWECFGNLLSDISAAGSGILSARAENQEILLTILNVSQSVGSGWLSTIRNNISYRHGYGAWFPHQEIDKKDSRKIMLDRKKFIDGVWASHWRLLALDRAERDQCLHFFSICRYIANLGASLAADLSLRSSKGLAFRNGVGRTTAQLIR